MDAGGALDVPTALLLLSVPRSKLIVIIYFFSLRGVNVLRVHYDVGVDVGA